MTLQILSKVIVFLYYKFKTVLQRYNYILEHARTLRADKPKTHRMC